MHVYYGGELLEKMSNHKDVAQFKLMVGRLYNAGVNAVQLKVAFGVARKTMAGNTVSWVCKYRTKQID